MTGPSRDRIRAKVRSILLRRESDPAFSDADRLVTSGRLHSMEVIELAVFLEQEFGVRFGVRPFDPVEFDTIEKIERLTN